MDYIRRAAHSNGFWDSMRKVIQCDRFWHLREQLTPVMVLGSPQKAKITRTYMKKNRGVCACVCVCVSVKEERMQGSCK
jgi:hypothetical protein